MARRRAEDEGLRALLNAGFRRRGSTIPRCDGPSLKLRNFRTFCPKALAGIGDVTVKTRAKPEIWKEHDKFLAADKAIATQIATLDAAVKGGDKTKVAALFKEIGFCAGCHDTFRAKE